MTVLCQTVAPPPAAPASNSAAPGSATDPAIELSPFEVRAADDVGYQAGNTTSVGVGRYNSAFNGLLRAYLNPPRTYRFTTTVEF